MLEARQKGAGTCRLLGMVEKIDPCMREIDPSTIEEEGLRQAFVSLMNLVETLSAKVGELTAETQRLRDEISRLKGEQGKPKITANKQAPDLSSEKERRQPKPRTSSSKQDQIPIDREAVLMVDRESPASRCGLQRVRGRGGARSRDPHGQCAVPQREILLAQSKADVSGPSSSRLPRPVWARSQSVGVGRCTSVAG